MSSGKHQLKQGDVTTLQIERPKPRSAGEDVEQQEHLFTAGGDVKRCGHLGRQFGGFLPYDAATLAPIYLKELKIYIHTKTCT